jgi:HK97 family phage prohead protease
MPERAPLDNLVRARHDVGTVELRADSDGTGRTLHGHFAVFNQWTEINSVREGRFMERIAPGAFARTFAERSGKIRVLYDHGHDPSIGNKPLGSITSLSEDRTGANYSVNLFEASYVNDLLPALGAGELGASFRFGVADDSWADFPKRSAHNPDGMRERTINDLDLYEFGPVTFPAYEGATAGLRSATDDYIRHLLADEDDLARYINRVGANAAAKFLMASLPVLRASADAEDLSEAADGADETPEASTDGQEQDTPRQLIVAALTRAGRSIPNETE